jgi:hypothetical protein
VLRHRYQGSPRVERSVNVTFLRHESVSWDGSTRLKTLLTTGNYQAQADSYAPKARYETMACQGDRAVPADGLGGQPRPSAGLVAWMMAEDRPSPAWCVLVIVMPVNPADSSKSRYCSWVRVPPQPTRCSAWAS